MKRKIFLRITIIIFLSFLVVAGTFEQMQKGIASGIVRLHIIANSNTEKDQKIKILVRDEIIRKEKEIFAEGVKKELNETERNELLKSVREVLFNSGVMYDAKIETGNFYFPTKEYENLTLPAGDYDAVRIVLGEGEGENWWCVMYPPLCFSESAKGKVLDENVNILKDGMSRAEYEMISKENVKIIPALKIFELWQEFKENIKNAI